MGPDLARFASLAPARGFILLSCGTRLNVIRLLPPLTIEWEVLEEGRAILEAPIEAAFSDAAAAWANHVAPIAGAIRFRGNFGLRSPAGRLQE